MGDLQQQNAPPLLGANTDVGVVCEDSVQRWSVVRRLSGGGDVTDREIYEKVRGPLMHFAASLVGPDDAADVVSEAVLATLQQRSLTSLDHPQAYLMRAVLNRARSHGRRQARERKALIRHGNASSVDDPTEVVGSDVATAVAQLPLRQRAAVYMVYWEGLQPSEAAVLLGVRPGTLRRYLYLARRKLRRHLDE